MTILMFLTALSLIAVRGCIWALDGYTRVDEAVKITCTATGVLMTLLLAIAIIDAVGLI